MSEVANRWIDRWLSRIVLFLMFGTCVCFIAIGYLQVQVQHQASAGAKARAVQMQRQPTFEKLLEWAARDESSGVTPADVVCFKTGRKCPSATTRTP